MSKKNQFALPILCTAVVSATGLVTFQAKAADATGTVDGRIVAAASIMEEVSLSFGDIVAGSAASVVTIDAAGTTAVASGDAQVVGGNAVSGLFVFGGEVGKTIAFNVPGSVTLTNAGGQTMVFNPSLSNNSLTVAGSEADMVKVVGSLNIGANQAVGTYTGTYTISANY